MISARIGRYDKHPDPFFSVKGGGAVNLTEGALKCVAFLGIKRDGQFEPRATAFFVNYLDGQHYFHHLVTAEHVISGLLSKGHDIWLRANLKNGQAREIPIGDPADFRFHPNNENDPTDVAVSPFNPVVADEATGEIVELDVVSLALHGKQGFLPTEEFTKRSIMLGAEIAIIGLFRSHYGKNRNVPIVRAGNISALLGEPIYTKYAGYIQAYLIEARSIAGLSGSPVIVIPEPSILLAKGLAGDMGQGAALLGLMHGHFDVPNLNEDVVADDNEPTRGIHTGIGVVIPLQKIIETIEHPELVAMRKKIIDGLRKESGATADTIPDNDGGAAPPASDANPKHREDFTSLVGAAARKRAQEG
jgi:hypothetical protein